MFYKDSLYAAHALSTLVMKPDLLMLYKAKVTDCSKIHTKHTNAM